MTIPFDPVSAGIAVSIGLYEHIIKPSAEKKNLERGRVKELEDCILRYIRSNYSRLALMKTIIYQGDEVRLTEYYHPLRLINNRTSDCHEVNSNCHFLLNSTKRIMIVDYAGMGKSTLSKFIFLRLCENKEYLPIFVELRRIREEKGIIDLIKEDMGEIEQPASPYIIRDLLNTSNVLIILDGFDEIPIHLKDSAMSEISNIVSRYPSVNYVITSRKDSLVEIAPSFQSYSIDELDTEDVEAILRLYDPNDRLASKILLEVKNITDDSFHDLLKNPMMVTLLLKSYSYNNEIPPRLHLFYDQVYKSLFNGHDLLKGYQREHKSKLDVDQFQYVLCHIAIQSIMNGPSYDRQSLVNHINTAAKQLGYALRPDDFLEDAFQAIPIFTEEGQEIRWVHKSFQDYFAAYYIAFLADENRRSILESIYNSVKSYQYSNMVEMCLDMKPSIIEEGLFLPIARAYLNFASISLERGIQKIDYDNSFFRSGVYRSEYSDLISISQNDPFQPLKQKYQSQLTSLIPSSSTRIRLQSMGQFYFAHSEATNYWIFELLLSKNPHFSKKVYDYDHSAASRSEIDELIFGHNNIQDLNQEQLLLARHVLAGREHFDYLIDIEESSLEAYVDQVEARLRTANIGNQF